MTARLQGWRSRLADRLISKRMQERVLLDDWHDLLQAARTLRDCEKHHVRDPLKEAAAAVLDSEEGHALRNWGGWLEWLAEFPEQCVNVLRLRVALGRGIPEELEPLVGLFRDAPEPFVDPEKERRAEEVAEQMGAGVVSPTDIRRRYAERPPTPPPDTDPGRDTKTDVGKPGGGS